MAALVCDICGGKLVMGAGGIAVCDSCGMEYTSDRIREKVQEIKGTVQVDNTHMIGNWLEMAESAKDAGNNEEAETYCNKILEVDPDNYKALMLKGEVVAWQSRSNDSRVDEGVSYFIKGIQSAPEDEKKELIEHAKDQISRLCFGMIKLQADRFAKWPDKDQLAAVKSQLVASLNTVVNFLSGTGAVVDTNDMMSRAATAVNNAVIAAYNNVIFKDYNGDPNDSDDRPNKFEWQRFIERADFCTDLLNTAISVAKEDKEGNIQRYKNLIAIENAVIDSCSWDYNFNYGVKNWHKEWSLTDLAKGLRRQKIAGYEAKLKECEDAVAQEKAAEQQKRRDEYWAEHAAEKAALESELAQLERQAAALEEEIAAIPGEEEKGAVQRRINELTREKNALGLFKSREKAAIADKIAAANAEIQKISNRMDAVKAEIESRLAPVKQRMDEINEELNKDR